MKVSIITAVYNGTQTIQGCIENILVQSYKNIEHIIVDGGSVDGTVDIIKRYSNVISYWVSEPDNGIYDAMNKGIMAATGDIVGILNCDDMYANGSVIEGIVKCLCENNVRSCYGDLVYVDQDDTDKVVRRWNSGDFYRDRFKRGWMPPHPTFFVKKSVYKEYGVFNTGFRLAADYELMLRFLYRYNISTKYIPRPLVRMRTGGSSHPGLYNTIKAIMENYKAWKINNLNPTPITFILKPVSKIFQYIIRR